MKIFYLCTKMKKKSIWIFTLVVMMQTGWIGLKGQNKPLKIGYTNLEIVLSLMPEYAQVEKELQLFEQKLLDQLKVKQEYAQMKLEEYQTLFSEGKLTPEQQKQMEQELLKLDKEIREFTQQSEQKLLEKRNEKLQPIIEKLQKAIDDIAKEEGYDYILNASNMTGISPILHAPPEHNITQKLLKKLGIDLPTEPVENRTSTSK